mgnify:CR=1 FL=1
MVNVRLLLNSEDASYDETTKQYTEKLGAGYTIEKVMPSPFRLNVTADIFSTNTDMKLQIMEQILYLFNPDFEIQKTDNYIDWTSLSYIELTGVTFSSRTIPVGADTEIDVATMQFSMPIWLSPPVKVSKLGVIQKIIMSIYPTMISQSRITFIQNLGIPINIIIKRFPRIRKTFFSTIFLDHIKISLQTKRRIKIN